jgi:helicase
MPSLINDIRQLFSEGVLQRYDRLEEARVDFTFNHGEIYLSSFAEALQLIDQREFMDFDRNLLAYAQVFEHYVTHPTETVKPTTSGLVSAALYWLSGYSANSFVISKVISESDEQRGQPTSLLLKILARRNLGQIDIGGEIDEYLSAYVYSGEEEAIERAINQAQQFADYYLRTGNIDEFISSYLLVKVLERLRLTSFWYWIRDHASASIESWQEYIRYSIDNQAPMIDLWPSQRTAIARGLLDGASSVIIRMPTSSGKTKMTELAFVNDLNSDAQKRCLYLAPYRALVSEVENTIGVTLSNIGFPVASLYGGSEANELEIELTNIARVIIATPEKIAAVLRLTGGSLSEFDTILLDEGHLLDSNERGTTYELQLATLRPQLEIHNRAIFLSAVLPNTSELATWLKGSLDALAEDAWQPTTMRVGVVRWPQGEPARLDYEIQTGQALVDDFFVPRLFEEDVWREENPRTGRLNKHSFPQRGNNGSIAAALSFQAAKIGPVIIYANRPDWANSTARRILERLGLQRPITTNLVDDQNRDRLRQLGDYLQATLGDQSLLPRTVINGFAIHHGGIPQRVRLIIEDEFRNQTIRLLIATNTIAQGVNFPARTVIVHSLPASDAPIRDFWNLAGRAGRALKETEGEVIILATGNLQPWRLNRFLDQGNSERAESRILFFVRELLRHYPHVSNETITWLLQNHDDTNQLARIVRSIDTYLLEAIAEDALADAADPSFDGLIDSLLGFHQAVIEDEEEGSNLGENVRNLMYARRNSVITRVPDGNTRRRYAQSGLSVDSSISLSELLPEMQRFFEEHPNLSEDAFRGLVEYISRVIELEQQNPEQIALLGYAWIQTGRYDRVFGLALEAFDSFDEAVEFTEQILCFQTPWVLSGFLRLLDQIEHIPDWFRLLPDYLRYGVNQQAQVWVMSLGFTDRRFAEWLLEIYRQENRIDPPGFRNLIQWILANRSRLGERIGQEWPRYFERLFDKITRRYQRIDEILRQQ